MPSSVKAQLAQMTASEIAQLDSYIAVLKESKNRAGNPLTAGTLVGYINKLKQLYVGLKENIFDPYEFEIWITDNGYAPGTFVQYIDIACKVAAAVCPDSVDDLETLRCIYSSINNDKENDDRRWRYKDALLAKFANVTYTDMLRKIINQAESELADSNYPKAQDNRVRIILICLMLSVNAPMRGDYRNIVIKNRMETVPPKTPYYDDGWIHTPPGSRLKDSDGLKDSPDRIDMRGAQELIETCIAMHDSEYLLGIPYNSSTFSRLLREQTKRTVGVETGLGIRFFRTKFSDENDEVTEKAHTILSVMGHSGRTHRKDYSGAARNEGAASKGSAAASCGGSYGPTMPEYGGQDTSCGGSYVPTMPEYGGQDTFIEEVAAGFSVGGLVGIEGIEEDDVDPEDSMAVDENCRIMEKAAEGEVMEAVRAMVSNGNFGGLVDYDSE